MSKYSIVVETNTEDPMQIAKAAGKIGIEIGKIGGDVLYFEQGDFREITVGEEATEAEIAEEQSLNESGEPFGPNKRPSHVPEDPPQVEPEKPKGRKYFKCFSCGKDNELVYGLEYPKVMFNVSCAFCQVSLSYVDVKTEVLE